MSKHCYLCGDENVYKPVEENHPNTIACLPCYQQEKIKEYRIKEAQKPKSEQKICCVCGEFLTKYDERLTDDDTGLRFHKSCKPQFDEKYKYKTNTCNYCHKTFMEVLKYKVDFKDRNTYACENCWYKQKIKQCRVQEAHKPRDQQRKCHYCHKFLTDYDKRYEFDEFMCHKKCYDIHNSIPNSDISRDESPEPEITNTVDQNRTKKQRTKNPYIISI